MDVALKTLDYCAVAHYNYHGVMARASWMGLLERALGHLVGWTELTSYSRGHVGVTKADFGKLKDPFSATAESEEGFGAWLMLFTQELGTEFFETGVRQELRYLATRDWVGYDAWGVCDTGFPRPESDVLDWKVSMAVYL